MFFMHPFNGSFFQFNFRIYQHRFRCTRTREVFLGTREDIPRTKAVYLRMRGDYFCSVKESSCSMLENIRTAKKTSLPTWVTVERPIFSLFNNLIIKTYCYIHHNLISTKLPCFLNIHSSLHLQNQNLQKSLQIHLHQYKLFLSM